MLDGDDIPPEREIAWALLGMFERALHSYFAGIIDGEGSITVNLRRGTGRHSHHPPQHILRVSVGNTNEELIGWLTAEFGGYVREIKYRQRVSGEWRRCWEWSVCSRAAAEVLELAMPYLRVKRRQAEIGLALQARKTGAPITAEELRTRDELREALHARPS